MVIIDTNIISDHIRQASESDTLLIKLAKKMSKDELALSLVSIQELYEGSSTKDEAKEQLLLATIAPLKILGYNYQIAQLAGKIARDLKEPIDLADAAIAATAMVNHAQVATINKKHFQKIPKLKLYRF